jgi:3-hydroxyacyl-[acyl-carrier-protein] dehydratase
MSSEEQQKKEKLGIKEIHEILPHRYPFLLIDKIIDYDLDKETIIGQKNLTINEAFFQGHFPGAPIMPGVLILEALAQTGAVLVHLKGASDKVALLSHVQNAKFRHAVRPGDVLTLEAQGMHLGRRGGKIKAVARVNDNIAVEAEMGFVLVKKERV